MRTQWMDRVTRNYTVVYFDGKSVWFRVFSQGLGNDHVGCFPVPAEKRNSLTEISLRVMTLDRYEARNYDDLGRTANFFNGDPDLELQLTWRP